MEGMPHGRCGQHAVSLAQAEFGPENVTAQTLNRKMVEKIVLFLEWLKR